ncbi:MAG TPA: SMP-30/gluconolactonase/LRE family protein [Gemmatimonadales bacterium]|nr:SMP-30/gluconolactonase/LRE family protein [Gemmatimonadales bacterium]
MRGGAVVQRPFAALWVVLISFLTAITAPLAAQLHPRPAREPIITRLNSRFDRLVPAGARLERIADDHGWAEGPAWVSAGGYLLFSDVVKNAIYRWREGEGERLFLQASGYTGRTPFAGAEPGSNGIVVDREGRIVFCQHGDRRIVRREPSGRLTVLVERYRGKRLNSPNDLVFKSNGDLYFTDPPFGLPQSYRDPGKELPFQGVYRLARDGTLTLLTTELSGPNGIAFSPDERTLYVSNADAGRLVWLAFSVQEDGTLGPGRVFYDGTASFAGRHGTADGMKVDARGNLFGVGPGGVYVFSPDGLLLGWFDFGGNVGNVAWGEDGSTLFIAANAAVYRVRLSTLGAGFERHEAQRGR